MPTPSPPRLLPHGLVRHALGADPDHPARPAAIVTVDAVAVGLQFLDGSGTVVFVQDSARLDRILARDDVCRLGDHPLCLVNEFHGVLGIATGPATPPARLEVLWVSQLGDDGGVVELLGDGDQPGWQILGLSQPAPDT